MTKLTKPYVLRSVIRKNLPNFLYDFFVDRLGLFGKGSDCEAVGGSHKWYNQDNTNSACYYCEVTRSGRLWEKGETENHAQGPKR